jgi:hypothetical protein
LAIQMTSCIHTTSHAWWLAVERLQRPNQASRVQLWRSLEL